MKMTFACISIAAMLLSACSGDQNNSNDPHDGTHLHEDGSVHTDHEATGAEVQEAFTAPADTANAHDDSTHHSHDGHDHPHSH